MYQKIQETHLVKKQEGKYESVAINEVPDGYRLVKTSLISRDEFGIQFEKKDKQYFIYKTHLNSREEFKKKFLKVLDKISFTEKQVKRECFDLFFEYHPNLEKLFPGFKESYLEHLTE